MQAECFVYLSEVDSMLTALLGIDFVEVREVIKDGARRTMVKCTADGKKLHQQRNHPARKTMTIPPTNASLTSPK